MSAQIIADPAASDLITVGWAATVENAESHYFLTFDWTIKKKALDDLAREFDVNDKFDMVTCGDRKKVFIVLRNAPENTMSRVSAILCAHGQCVVEPDPLTPDHFIAAVAQAGASHMLEPEGEAIH
jgi:hypothetical protein